MDASLQLPSTSLGHGELATSDPAGLCGVQRVEKLHLEIQSFHTAINALSMARHYLLQGDEQAAEHKACAALAALRNLLAQARASGLPATGAAAH